VKDVAQKTTRMPPAELFLFSDTLTLRGRGCAVIFPVYIVKAISNVCVKDADFSEFGYFNRSGFGLQGGPKK